ncbi:c-type cytochrome [Olivibacter sp. SDN3]|uniref:cytochrome-c peroxidase n=1 Tax=Olivibacter sp. SDN3 TaxID=2764720 RepID=UPI00165133C6|nr:cytochrome c peroxidase [Olivibacter sp. SDN3]QNL48218.1 c-type cytochrome [Olivibacter sp. SDN3]
MRRSYALYLISVLLVGYIFLDAFRFPELQPKQVPMDSLRQLYERPITAWPQPTVDSGIYWKEFSALPSADSSYFRLMEQADVVLGKNLFFDPILSGSNQISCSSCHDPQTSWADNLSVPVGHDHQSGRRNTLSLLNVDQRKSFFWDGRAGSLEEQAKSPIEAHNEMAMDVKALPRKLHKITAYRKLFHQAYGTDSITFDYIAQALAAFQRTLKSRQSRFDRFLNGEYKRLSDQELYGMHLFRTKARCMNCHYGQYLTDEEFHNIGLTYYKRKYEDLGRYHVTGKAEDVGKFRTPSLRDVMKTNPWMHNGLFDNMIGVLNIYNSGMQMNTATDEQKAADPLHPVTDPLLQELHLSKEEIQALAAFLESVTASQYKMHRPETLPR